jgi:hypothetical protein
MVVVYFSSANIVDLIIKIWCKHFSCKSHLTSHLLYSLLLHQFRNAATTWLTLFAWDNFFMARSYSFKKKRIEAQIAATFWDFYLLIHGISIIEQNQN